MTADRTAPASSPSPPPSPPGGKAPARERLAPYAIVLTLGVCAAAGLALAAEDDPLAWALPALVLTTLLLVLITLIDGRPEERVLARAADELGLRHERARTLPPVTPVLAAVKEPRSAQTLEGDLDIAGPTVRLARVRVGRVPLLVALTDLDGRDQALEDPHGILGQAGLSAPPAPADPLTASWLAEQPLLLAFATGDDALVALTPLPRGDDPPFGALLEATRELRRRLVRAA